VQQHAMTVEIRQFACVSCVFAGLSWQVVSHLQPNYTTTAAPKELSDLISFQEVCFCCHASALQNSLINYPIWSITPLRLKSGECKADCCLIGWDCRCGAGGMTMQQSLSSSAWCRT